MVQPARAAVKPRILSPETGELILLDETIQELAAITSRGAIELVGGRGAGKTTALRHLAAELQSDKIAFLDEPEVAELRGEANQRLVIFTACRPGDDADRSFALAPWSSDDAIEYLLAAYPHRCQAVMSIVQGDDFREALSGRPVLWRFVLDELATHAELRGVREAIAQGLERQWPDREAQRLAGLASLAHLLGYVKFSQQTLEKLAQHGLPAATLQLLRCRAVRLVLASRHAIAALHNKAKHLFRDARPGQDLILEIARLAAADQQALDRLVELLDRRPFILHPIAASIMHAAGTGWRPTKQRFLAHGYFAEADWSQVDLPRAKLWNARLDRANLTGANLERALLHKCSLRGAVLCGARLSHARCTQASLQRADLSDVTMDGARLLEANLSGAVCDRGWFFQALLIGANLSGASFRGAGLDRADLRGATVDEADFSDASFVRAQLKRLTLRKAATLQGARFDRAGLVECDLEDVDFPDASFSGANLSNALLTGSFMPRANFQLATLKNCGLADVEWEQADLRGADLRGSEFHLGSSRSGLVGSPYPCHGSRTGFYTDAADEQYFKAPEEIRKANLCGADLRGARVLETDFYLVDLRGAKYDLKQADHFRRCGAILNSRV